MGLSGIADAVSAVFGAIKAALGLAQSQADANKAAVVKQSGIDAERAAGLATVNATQEAQAKAIVDAPSDAGGVADLARKGGL